MKRTTITLPEPLANRIAEESRRKRVSVSQLVREALEARFIEAGEGDRFPFFAIVNSGGYPESDQAEEYLERHWLDDLVKDTGR